MKNLASSSAYNADSVRKGGSRQIVAGREGGREGGRERGREGGNEGGSKGGREGVT